MQRALLITGGAGFIGSNAAHHFSGKGWNVTVLDNLSRKGGRLNLDWLQSQARVQFIEGDVRDWGRLEGVFSGHEYEAVLHLAGQVAVTTSVAAPREDFESNAMGTFNVLEATRLYCPDAVFVYASTNKVYGKMEKATVVERNGRYEYEDLEDGASESTPLDFHSPYGCSKGAGDQYVIDYARIYGLRSTAFRQSCIYGPRQFGVEDQGWVAWFAIAAILGRRLTVYGDGKQIRDVLHVDDLIRAYEAAIEHPDVVGGQAFNIGGGKENTLSLLELLEILRGEVRFDVPIHFDDWRPGDQRVFVSDITKAKHLLAWAPQIGAKSGIACLFRWIRANQACLEALFPRQ